MIEEKFIECRWGKACIRKYNGDNSLKPVVAIHGWLDNSASFEPISPLLTSTIYAIDLPGHGKSTHLPDGNWYHFIDYIEKTHEVISKLDLKSYVLLGHSMGAAIAMILAATFPEKVQKLIMIDGVGPLLTKPDLTCQSLREAITSREHVTTKKKRYFQSVEQAAALRKSVGGLSIEAASTLVMQQLQHDKNGYSWSYDSKLSHKSSLRMTPDQLMSFYREVSCPVLLIKATEGILKGSSYKTHIKGLTNLHEVEVLGGHHLHMDNSQVVAGLIENFQSHK